MERIDSASFYSENVRTRMLTGQNTMQVLMKKAALFRTLFGYTCYREFALVEEKKSFSKSLTDLAEYEHRKERTSKSALKEVELGNLSTTAFLNKQISLMELRIAREAGRRVTNLIMLHAWRCRRLDAQQSRALVQTLSNQVENLNMQMYALRQLLNNEKTRRELAVKEIYKEKTKNEREEKVILEEKEALESKLKELLDSVKKKEDEGERLKHNFEAAKAEAETWECRYKKETKKSSILKDQNLILEQEIRTMNEKLVNQTQCLDGLNRRKTELEEELDIQIPLLNEAMERIYSTQKELKLSEELGEQQERFLMEKDEEINQLRAQIALMEEKLQEQHERNGELGKLISDKTKELVLLHDKLGELTKNQRFWGNRAIKMVSLCTRIPIACFYTVAMLLLPQPSYRSL